MAIGKYFKDLTQATDLNNVLGVAEKSDGTPPGYKFSYSKTPNIITPSDAVILTESATVGLANTAQSNAESYADGKFYPKGTYTANTLTIADGLGQLTQTTSTFDESVANTITLTNGSGSLEISNTSVINQDVSTTATPTFNDIISLTNLTTFNKTMISAINELYAFPNKINNDISYFCFATPTKVLTTSGAGDLAAMIATLVDGDILEIQTNASYSPITIPGGVRFAIRVKKGYDVELNGAQAITLANGAANVFLAGFIFDSNTGGGNGFGSAIGFAHQAIVNDITFFDCTFRNNNSSAVLLSYHQSIGGDNYATAPLLSEFSYRVSFVQCNFDRASNDATEGAAIAMRGIFLPYIYNCNINARSISRGIQLQDCLYCLVSNNKVLNAGGGGNGEGIKLDQLGTPTYYNSGIFYRNNVSACIEGIDIDDTSESIVQENIVSLCSNEGIVLDDSSKGIFVGNITYNNQDGIRFELGSVGNLKCNVSFNNSNSNYLMDNGYVPDNSNTSIISDTFIGSDKIPYDNTTSGLTSTLVKNAIDELTPPDAINIIYFGKGGNDSNDGLTWGKRKVTADGAYNAAKTAFGTLTSSNRAVIWCEDAGVYGPGGSASFTMDTEWLDIYAPNATLAYGFHPIAGNNKITANILGASDLTNHTILNAQGILTLVDPNSTITANEIISGPGKYGIAIASPYAPTLTIHVGKCSSFHDFNTVQIPTARAYFGYIGLISLGTVTTGSIISNECPSVILNGNTTCNIFVDQGNLTESTSSVLTITGGTQAVIGSGTTIEVKQAGAAQSGYLSSTDWNTFNSSASASVEQISDNITITSNGQTSFPAALSQAPKARIIGSGLQVFGVIVNGKVYAQYGIDFSLGGTGNKDLTWLNAYALQTTDTMVIQYNT